MPATVLFVDDNPVIRKTIQVAFRNEPYTLLLAAHGEEGLALVRNHHPQVIVSDLRMPGMDGLEFLRQARREWEGFIGMIFTAYLDLDCIMEAVSEEAVWRYIAKPWQDNRELVIAVRNAIQLYQAREARNRAEDQLARSERLATLGQLITGIAHQFNNINAGIMAHAQLARGQAGLDATTSEHLERILLFAKRAARIVKELAAFSDQGLNWGFQPLDFRQLVSEELQKLAPLLQSPGVVLETDLQPTPPLEANPSLLRQLVANLITNALDATLGQGERRIRVTVAATSPAGCRLQVSDNGCGMPPEVRKQIFDPFFTTKGHQAKPNSPLATVPGVGLGLSLCQTIVSCHNGELSVDSAPGQGATFTVRLPAGPESTPANGRH